jgi:hypothetical protein
LRISKPTRRRGLDALGDQGVGHGMRGVVEFLERHLAVVVDDGRPVRCPARVERGDHADLAPLADVGEHPDEVLRRLDLERAGRDILRA